MTRNWLAAYTKARHETAVAKQLEAKEVPFLLPTFVKSSQWSDRTKRVPAPLFPSYLRHNPRFVWAICRQMAGWDPTILR